MSVFIVRKSGIRISGIITDKINSSFTASKEELMCSDCISRHNYCICIFILNTFQLCCLFQVEKYRNTELNERN